MEDVAAEAGISRATLFRRFPSRGALVAALSRDAAALFVSAVDRARPEEGPAPEAMRRVLGELAGLAPRCGLLVLQPLPDLVEAELLGQIAEAERRLEALVRRGQDEGAFRGDLPAGWVVLVATWLLVGAADGLRLGRLAPRDIDRLVAETVMGALRRADA